MTSRVPRVGGLPREVSVLAAIAFCVALGYGLVVPAIPLFARTFGLGVAGVFWALTATSVLRGLAFAFWFARGRWVHARA